MAIIIIIIIWSMPEKKGFAIVESMGLRDYLVVGRVVSIFTNNENFVYLYYLYEKNSILPIHTVSILFRGVLKMNSLPYVIEHFPSGRTVWADVLKRWAMKPRDSV